VRKHAVLLKLGPITGPLNGELVGPGEAICGPFETGDVTHPPLALGIRVHFGGHAGSTCSRERKNALLHPYFVVSHTNTVR
jgi:hypothetical protein